CEPPIVSGRCLAPNRYNSQPPLYLSKIVVVSYCNRPAALREIVACCSRLSLEVLSICTLGMRPLSCSKSSHFAGASLLRASLYANVIWEKHWLKALG
uniref:Uncharacterized protein n=1 Tax=Ciona intestinalis TaxID=7719 RepID=H2XRB6_CIOIN